MAMLRALLLVVLAGAAAAQLREDCRDANEDFPDPTVCACGYEVNRREVRCPDPPPGFDPCLESVCNLDTLQCEDWTKHAGCCRPGTIDVDCGTACDWICDAVDPVEGIGECVKDPASTSPDNEFCCESAMPGAAELCPEPNACQEDFPICNANNQCEYQTVPFCCDPPSGLLECTTGPDTNCIYACDADPNSETFAHCLPTPDSPCSCDSILFETDPVLAMETCLPPNDCMVPVTCEAGQCIFEPEPLCCLPEDINNAGGRCADANLPAGLVCRQRSCLVLAGETHGECLVDQDFYPDGCCDDLEDCPDGAVALCQGDPIACVNNRCVYEFLDDCQCADDADCADVGVLANECEIVSCVLGTCTAVPNPQLPGCCATDADCGGLATRACETASCPTAGGTCVVDSASCCDTAGCPASDACNTITCNAVTGNCDTVTTPDCCASDADCTGLNVNACQVASCIGNTCQAVDNANIDNCCLSNADCSGLATRACETASCPAAGASCVVDSASCCDTAGCPASDACNTVTCNAVTGNCDTVTTPDCCASDADCAGLNVNACQVASCIGNTCQAVDNANIDNCCLSNADCGGLATRACETASCPAAGASCVVNSASCCDAAGCPAGDACNAVTCNAITGACDTVTTPDCCVSDAECAGAVVVGECQRAVCLNNVCAAATIPNCPAITPCSPNPCGANGNCLLSGAGFQCRCINGYTGALCTTPPPCLLNPCQNGGTCEPSGGSYRCTCAAGFSGTSCETASSPCNPNPCGANGNCLLSGAGFQCRCINGYTGALCTTPPPCSLNPCQNGGTCEPSGGSYRCTCAAGFSGTNCETGASLPPPPSPPTSGTFRCELTSCGCAPNYAFPWCGGVDMGAWCNTSPENCRMCSGLPCGTIAAVVAGVGAQAAAAGSAASSTGTVAAVSIGSVLVVLLAVGAIMVVRRRGQAQLDHDDLPTSPVTVSSTV